MSVCFLGRNTLTNLINSSSLISVITHLNEGILCHILQSRNAFSFATPQF